MRKQKIALVNVYFPPQSIGGATRVLADNFDILTEQYGSDFELVVFTSDAEMQEKPHALDVYTYKGVRVYRSSILFRKNMDWHPKDSEMGKLFKKFLDFEKPDKVHFHCVQRLSASIVEITMREKIPYYITLHDAWWISDFQFLVDTKGKVYLEGHADPYEQITLPESISEDASVQRKLYFTKLLAGAEKLFTVSESFKSIYMKNGVSNIVVTKNGISDNVEWKEKDTSYTNKVVCGHIGGMAEHKGYDILKKAAIDMDLNNIEFLIADHSKEEDYESHEMWGKIPVTFIGRVKQDEIVALYDKIDVLFAPSIWPESFGLVTREAVACGCWVVASNLGGMGEDVVEGETGFVISPTIKSLEDTLKELDSNVEKYKAPVKPVNIRYASEQVDELVEYYKAEEVKGKTNA